MILKSVVDWLKGRFWNKNITLGIHGRIDGSCNTSSVRRDLVEDGADFYIAIVLFLISTDNYKHPFKG